MLDRYSEYEKMHAVEGGHWWYRCLHRRVLNAIASRYGTDREISILDAGCGTGGLLQSLKTAGYFNISGFDFSEHAVGFCRQHDLDVKQASLLDMESLYQANKFDVIVSNDVLYFVDSGEQRRFIEAACSRLTAGGLLIMNLPYSAAFSGNHDRAVGISQRFEAHDIENLVVVGQLKLIHRVFWPGFLAPLIYLVRRKQKKKLGDAGKDDIRSDIDLPAPWQNNILYVLACIDRLFGFKFQMASSVFIVSEKV